MNIDLLDEVDAAHLCKTCQAQCCKLGGATASKLEVEAIIAKGYINHFVKMSDDVYITKWVNDGVCPYLIENECSIYEVRPLGCRLFPVSMTLSGQVCLVKCPLASILAEETIEKRKALLLQRPRSFTLFGRSYLKSHINRIKMRISKFKVKKIE